MRNQVAIAVAIGFVLLGHTAASAQPSKDRAWTGQLALGFAFPQGDTSDVSDDDWHFLGGATYRPPEWPVALSFELAWHELDIDQRIINIINNGTFQNDVDDGFIETWTITANAAWPFIDRDNLEVYATGGVGYYDVEAKLTETALYGGWVCDPWYWWCYPAIDDGDVLVGERSWEEFGYNAGLGIAWDLRGGNQVYLEARYHLTPLDQADYEYVPFTVGFKF
jgi:opacity protein-like surface antigen